MTQLTVQGNFDLSSNRLVVDFGNIFPLLNNQTHPVLLSQQSNNQGSKVSPVLQQPSFIQKHSLRFVSSALGLAGGVGLLVSCIWSVLLPAIGSIGVIGIAYLVNRKISPLHTKEMPSGATKTQSLFEEQIGSGVGSKSSLNEPVNKGNLQPPNIPPLPLPSSKSSLNEPVNKGNLQPPNIPPPPLPSSKSSLNEPVNKGNLQPPNIPPPPPLPSSKSSLNEPVNKGNLQPPNIPPPPPLPSSKSSLNEPVNKGNLQPPNIPPPPPLPSSKSSLNAPVNKGKRIREEVDADKPSTSKESITSKGWPEQIKERPKLNKVLTIDYMRQTVKDYPSTLLLELVRVCYEKGQDISKSKLSNEWKKYFSNKVNKFNNKFDLKEQMKDPISSCTDNIFEKIKDLDSLVKIMECIQCLLNILSKCQNLPEKTRKYCTKKLKKIEDHIKKLKEEDSGISTRNTIASGILATMKSSPMLEPMSNRRKSLVPSSSDSENESDHDESW
ncbi:hypothetical protein RHABOEDO_001330 [Candidatus Rhabdochlamydia oedothoracis]|uniref:Uncharacterized protein n=1 Tax=Candidatus Rhabdochlamydia oedothoracis TaxID=2720720 RepID=A0ABX8V1G9_9BACT|nr:hypothetical protein [Candidatus Rhabdochlamydia oedothoracis]QYF49068.1 hypothetical protein RHABOEDO_001330 [Candidatus Rhabdochlamydia oedothoracis]